ncbi:hypothetical protein ACG1BZ_12565 [Microbulbifer sp. CNSA002]|uniref:hypothetical protein n=1 Tax=Microbulbifer sp. CNSA002 TaxID=3373604 RepID=UPI0039B57DC2
MKNNRVQRGNLKPAHAGYRYQDIATAYYLVSSLIGRCDRVTVDKKQVEDDRLDDLEVSVSGRNFRRQIKTSPDNSRPIKYSDFTAGRSTLRIDRLVLTHKRGLVPSEEYRLCATWQPPAADDKLLNYIIPIVSEPTFTGTNVVFYKFDADLIWPKSADPDWPVLEAYNLPSAEFCREDFLEFCGKFIIELNLPLASEDLLNPGPLENSLLHLLEEHVGVGCYPNLGRKSQDVAALAISLANLARTQEATLLPEDIANGLEIRTDFGRISQAFPLDKSYFYDRPEFRNGLISAFDKNRIHIITAPPGAGKSWELTQLADEISSEFVVARHYCYLEPGDELIERRITTDVFFANVISELCDADPEINNLPSRLSADLKTLEEVLAGAVELGKRVLLIIDGLDHISRVKSASNTLSDDDTDIIERLSTLVIPDGVNLILGSQPGEHLDPFMERRDKDVTNHELPHWSNEDVISLAKLHRVDKALLSIGISELEETESILDTLADKSDGNPLYVRYLCRGVISAIEAGQVSDPSEWLLSSPEINGDVAVYYKHLYGNLLDQAQAIADLFGVIDFSITEAELKDMLPGFLSSWIPNALSALSPVLVKVAAQGGVRIFHESFRRFMLDELEVKGRSLNDVLSPVVDWLCRRGFYQNAKSYRFLFPALRRAGRNQDIIDQVKYSFVSESVSYGHPIEAIQKNLAITADVAGRTRNWPVLVRCAELRRSLSTCFDIGPNHWESFWSAYSKIWGVESLVDRLLFDGKPTLSYEDGLRACLLVDDLGGVAPWEEYLSLSPVGEDSYYDRDFDHSRYITEDEALNLAAIQGRFRLGGGWKLLLRFYRYLLADFDNPRLHFIRKVAMRFSRMGNLELMNRLALKLHERGAPRLCFSIKLGVADALWELGDTESAGIVSREALGSDIPPSLAVMCVKFGAVPENPSLYAVDPSSIDIGVSPGDHWPEAQNVRTWVSSIKLVAYVEDCDRYLEKEATRLQGEGWYRCWLRYVLALAQAEASENLGIPIDIKSVFSLLTEDVRPFVGEPRACDLYRLHGLIEETLASGLTLVASQSDWDFVINSILTVSSETGTRIDREDGGPVPIGTIIDLLVPYASSEIVGQKIHEVIEGQVKASDSMGTYYSTHAEHTMRLASVQMAMGHIDAAKESWRLVGVYLAAYGWRKDITLFDIIESVSAIKDVSREKASDALDKLQPLVAAVLRHTDGRSTNQAPNAWFDSLLDVDPPSALNLLSRTILEEDCVESWPTVKALKSVANYLTDKANPILVDALWATLPFEVEYENQGKEVAKERLAPLPSIYEKNPKLASARVRHLTAEAADDAKNYNYESIEEIKKFAIGYGGVIDSEVDPPKDSRFLNDTDDSSLSPSKFVHEVNVPCFPKDASFIDIMVGLRDHSERSKSKDDEDYQDVSLYLSYKLEEMQSNGDEVSARRILHFFAREMAAPLSSKLHPLGKLAEYLESSGCNSLAVIAYALAYTHSRGGGGWHSFGGGAHSGALIRAISIDSELAKQTVADEVSFRLRNTDYGAGISKGLIDRIFEWGDAEVALDCWNEAFEVICHRLPLTRPTSWFAKFFPNEISNWSVDEGVISILLVRLSEPRVTRKISSLSGIFKAIKYCPDSVCRPLKWWLCRDTPTTSLLLVFQLLLMAEEAPYSITIGLKGLFNSYVRSGCWGASLFASTLLERAGLDVSSSIPSCADVSSFPDPSTEMIRQVFDYDMDNSLKLLAEVDPDLPSRVCKMLNSSLKKEANIDRIKERLKLSFGRDGKAYPPTDVIFWQQELFISAIHGQAQGIRNRLWKRGSWTEDRELSLLVETQPDIALHLAIYNSRIPRPGWGKPSEAVSGESGLLVVKGDSRYEGWLRLGLVEEQYVGGEHNFSRPTEIVKVFSGAAVAPIGVSCTSEYFPFYDGDHNDWWGCDFLQLHRRPIDRWTQLLPLTRHKDWLDSDLVLIPPKELLAVMGVQFPNFGEELVWKDSKGKPLLAYRSWNVKGKQFDVESASIIGADLVARPDVIELLEGLFSSRIRQYTDLSRRTIPA